MRPIYFLGVLLTLVTADCFKNKIRYPLFLQSQTGQQDSRWLCIDTSVALNAIFVGGYIKKANLLATTLPTNTYVPVIARINGDTNLYKWQIAYGAPAESNLESVIALAIQESDESKMAVAAIEKDDSWNGRETTYIFVVDTKTGAHVGKAAKFFHGGDDWKMYVVNQGLLMSQGQVYVAFFSDFRTSWGSDGWTGGQCDS
jgi:hypothetical protein